MTLATLQELIRLKERPETTLSLETAIQQREQLGEETIHIPRSCWYTTPGMCQWPSNVSELPSGRNTTLS